jgi:hypothetical protein
MSPEDYIDNVSSTHEWEDLDNFKRVAIQAFLGSRNVFEAFKLIDKSGGRETRAIHPDPTILTKLTAIVNIKRNKLL